MVTWAPCPHGVRTRGEKKAELPLARRAKSVSDRPHQPWAATKHVKKARPLKSQSQLHRQQARSPPQVTGA